MTILINNYTQITTLRNLKVGTFFLYKNEAHILISQGSQTNQSQIKERKIRVVNLSNFNIEFLPEFEKIEHIPFVIFDKEHPKISTKAK